MSTEEDVQNQHGIVIEGVEPLGSPLVVQEALPDTVFVFPLRRAVPFPNLMMPVLLDSPRAREIVAKAEAHNSHVLLLTQKDPEEDEPGPKGLYEVGVLARVLKTLQLPDGNASAMTPTRSPRSSASPNFKPAASRISSLVTSGFTCVSPSVPTSTSIVQ